MTPDAERAVDWERVATELAEEIGILKRQTAALRAALADLVERIDRNGGLGEYKGGVPFSLKNARAVLADPEGQR